MASILKVDQIQTPSGTAPTAADLGLDVSGSVVQVQSVHIPASTVYSTASTTWVNSAYGVTVTPKFATSKFLVVLQFTVGTSTGNPYVGVGINGVATGLTNEGFARSQTDYSWPNYVDIGSVSYTYIPGSASDITFSIMMANQTGGTTYLNRAGTASAGIGTSSLTVYEIAQ